MTISKASGKAGKAGKAVLAGLLGAAACGEPAAGKLSIRVDGERFVEQGMAASLFRDGWALRFDHFLVSVGEVSLGDRADAGYRILDLARPSAGKAHELALLELPDGAYDRLRYTIAPSPTAAAGNVSEAEAEALRQAGASVRIRATATREGQTHRLDLAFAPRLAHDCALAGKLEGERPELRATLHADHLLMDNTAESSLRLQLLVDADGAGGSPRDGITTAAELAATAIDGNADYRVLSTRDFAGQPITDLRQYIERRLGTIGHVDGENPCAITGTI